MRNILLAATALTTLAGFAFAQSSQQPNPSSVNPAESQSSTSQTPGAASDTTGSQPGSSAAPPPTGSASQQSGIRQVGAASLRLTFYTVQAADMRASDVIGADVYNLDNEEIGEVEDLLIDNGKNIKAVVISVGGFLGMGDRNVAVEPGSVVLSKQRDGDARMVVNTTKEELKNAPAFDFADMDKAGTGAGTAGQGGGTSGSASGYDASGPADTNSSR